jgi:hypothetical protein
VSRIGDRLDARVGQRRGRGGERGQSSADGRAPSAEGRAPAATASSYDVRGAQTEAREQRQVVPPSVSRTTTSSRGTS